METLRIGELAKESNVHIETLRFYERRGLLKAAKRHRLGFDSVAWDVYFLFDRSTAWQKDVPQPTFWMHQLRVIDKAPFLNEKEFQSRLKTMLEVKK